MGNLSDSMRTLVDEITATTHDRRAHLRELVEETREARRGWQSELQAVSQSLRDSFATHRAQRAANNRAQRETTHQLMDEIHRVNEQRRVAVSELRSEAHSLIERFDLEHQDMAEALRERLSSASNVLQGAVREMVGALAADRYQAHQSWTERLKKKLTPEAVAAEAVVAETAAEVEAQPEVQAAQPLPLEERVLAVIARHPQGIRLVDIGNDLGVDWRSLLGISRAIVDEDKVERIDNLYYPKGGGPHEAGEEV